MADALHVGRTAVVAVCAGAQMIGERIDDPSGAVFDTIALLAYTEVPGVYVRVDKGFVFAFDHVHAKVASRRGSELVVRLSNPNSVDAAVRVLAETSVQAAEPLPLGGIAAIEATVVPARGSVEVKL